MEITSEVKYKAAMQYYGCKILVCHNLEGKPVIEDFAGINIVFDLYAPDFDNKRDLLILKPISAISDEDAVECLKIHEMIQHSNGMYVTEFSHISKIKIAIQAITVFRADAYQFLQSKGYDLPNYILGGKTLKEAGLAIY